MVFTHKSDGANSLVCVHKDEFDQWLNAQTSACQQQVSLLNFKPKAGAVVKWAEDAQAHAALIMDEKDYFESFGTLHAQLGAGVWQMENPPQKPQLAYLVYGLGSYTYNRFKSDAPKASDVCLYIRDADLLKQVKARYDAVCLTRDLINTPTSHLTPPALSAQAKNVAEQFGASYLEIKGEKLQQEFPSVWAVGKSAGMDSPRMVELRWGQDKSAKQLTLVGKGVCFDTGGVNVKPASSMRWMKKDMGGAANVLGLAWMIMALDLNIRLRVILPLVENVISTAAYKPGDIVTTRSGKTIEIGHTDAEGRVILADALSWASEEPADLIVDMATLTGAARVALGEELGALFSNKDDIAQSLMKYGKEEEDYLWQLPLFAPYGRHIKKSTGDINNAGEGAPGMAGAITAALFLSEFIPSNQNWVHLDIYGWSSGRAGRPNGGELYAGRALLAYLEKEFI